MHLLRSERRGRSFGAYYSKTLAICNDDSSIKNGSLAKLIQRIGSVLVYHFRQHEMTTGVGCRRKTSISLTLAHSLGTLVKTILRRKSVRLYGIKVEGAYRLGESLTQVDELDSGSLQKVCRAIEVSWRGIRIPQVIPPAICFKGDALPTNSRESAPKKAVS